MNLRGAAWPMTSVGDEFELQLGKMLDANKNSGELKSYIGNRAVQWGAIDRRAVGTVPLSRSDQLRFRLRAGDLLVCEGGAVGRGAIWRNEIAECYYQKALHRLRPKRGYNSRVMLAFLEYWTQTGGFADFVTQTSIAHLPRAKFIAMPLPAVPPDEQRMIASALHDTDDLISALLRLITKQQVIKQAMMKQLLTGKARLPGFVGEWVDTKLGDIATVSRGASPRPIASDRWFASESNVGWVRISDLSRSDGLVLRSTQQKLSDEGIARSRYLEPGTLIMSIAATVGLAIVTGMPACIHDGFVALEGLKVDQSYLLYVLKSSEKTLRAAGQTGSQPNVNTGIVAGLELTLPPRAEQEAISRTLRESDETISSLERMLAKTQAVKQGVLQELLTGRTRLVAAQVTT